MRRKTRIPDQDTIDVQGVLGTFKVPNADLTVEYILTYASLDGTPYNRLLDLLVPVREVFSLKDLDFDHLLQRDLDDFRVSEEMVPYLLGTASSDPRFFPPIVAVIVPMDGQEMKSLYPQRSEKSETVDVLVPSEKPETESEKEEDFKLKVFKYGDVFTVKREEHNGRLAQSLVDLCIHPMHAKLVIVDGQHRAMAMLAAYRSTSTDGWKNNKFQHFYQKVDSGISKQRDIHLQLPHIHLPVCIVYFPELTQDNPTSTVVDLRTACRKFFLDVNRNARNPSKARQILLDDTDIIACFTRHLFNMVQSNTKDATIQLHHTEYDNPQDRIPITRPFALTDVYTLYNVVRSVLLLDDRRVGNPIASASGGRQPENFLRLQREIDLENEFTEEDKEQYDLEISQIRQNDYPRGAEKKLRQCFEKTWGQIVITSLEKLYPFAKHIQAVEFVLKEHEPYTGVNDIAKTALIEGQGLRHTLYQQQLHDKKDEQVSEETHAQKAWTALQRIEEDFEKCRARLYLKLNEDPDENQIKTVNYLYDCFRSSAFQNGLLMAFAYLKYRMEIDRQEFINEVEKWIKRINTKFNKNDGVRMILFDHSNPKSLRSIYKPRGGLKPSDWTFCRYTILELLSIQKGKERTVIDQAKTKWRQNLYDNLHKRKKSELRSEEDDQNTIDHELLSFREIVDAYINSLEIDSEELEVGLDRNRNNNAELQDEYEQDENDDLSEE